MKPVVDGSVESLIAESVLDDYENLIQIVSTVKAWAEADGIPIATSEIPLLVTAMVESGRINCYLFSKESNAFVPAKFESKRQSEYWFRAVARAAPNASGSREWSQNG